MRTRYKITDQDGIYFITSTIVEWIPVFTTKPYFDILALSLTFCRKQKELQLFSYVILDNHFHCITQAPDLSGTMTSIKKFIAKTILLQIKKDYKS